MRENWEIKKYNYGITTDLSKFCQNEFLQKMLASKNFQSQKEIESFLNPLDQELISYNFFVDIEKSVNRVKNAINNNEKIIIYGDFDADGVSSTAILYKTLKTIGANVDFYIPSRLEEGHGLNNKALVKLISKKKAKLIITCDCGISDVNEAKFLKSFKVDLIITDHHWPIEELPICYGIINPKVKGCILENLSHYDAESLNALAGAGVALKFACALIEEYKKTEILDELIILASIGTISDVVPILYENRIIVSKALKFISQKKHKGLSIILEKNQVSINNVNAETIAFTIIPRINAEGRLETCDNSFKILTSNDDNEIIEALEILNKYNATRQKVCSEIFCEASNIIEKENLGKKDAIILYKPNWHIGVIGIVASKICEKYGRPCFLMASDKNKEDYIRCSARGVSEVDIHKLIMSQSEFLDIYGGHKGAGGFSFYTKNISFDNLKLNINKILVEDDSFSEYANKIYIDFKIQPDDLTLNLIESLKIFEPFGEENHPPVFLINNVKMTQGKIIGANSNHSKFTVISNENNNIQFECVFWNNLSVIKNQNSNLSMVFTPKINQFNNNKKIQLDIIDVCMENCNIENKNVENKVKIYDHRTKTQIYNKVCDYIKNIKDEVSIFVENKDIYDNLCKYYDNKKYFCTRNKIDSSKHLFFYDYPSSEEILNSVLEKTKAKYIHFMNYDINLYNNIENYIKTVSGMLKYAYNNKDGKIDTENVKVILSCTFLTLNSLIETLEDIKMIEIEKKYENTIEFKFLDIKEMSLIKQSSKYNIFLNNFNKTLEYRKFLKSCSINEILPTRDIIFV